MRPEHAINATVVFLLIDPTWQLHDDERQFRLVSDRCGRRVGDWFGTVAARGIIGDDPPHIVAITEIAACAPAPQRPPFTDHATQQFAIRGVPLLVLFALIPQHAARGERGQPAHHRVECAGDVILGERGDGRRPRALAVPGVEHIPRDVRFCSLCGGDLLIPRIKGALPGVGFVVELLIGFAVDLLMVAVKIAAPGLGGGEHVLAHPRGDRRTADIAIDDTDRYVGSQVPP